MRSARPRRIKPGFGENDRIEVLFVEFPQPRIDVTA